MMLQLTGIYAIVINKLFLDYIKKFHQLSNPIREYYVSADIDQVLLQKNIENYSKISLEEYEVLKTDKFIIELDKIINNITNEKCLYFVIYSFYNDKYLKNGNYAYDFTGSSRI